MRSIYRKEENSIHLSPVILYTRVGSYCPEIFPIARHMLHIALKGPSPSGEPLPDLVEPSAIFEVDKKRYRLPLHLLKAIVL